MIGFCFLSDGLLRVLDSQVRTYSVHLELSDASGSATSDYRMVLSPKKKVEDEKEVSFLVRLVDLTYSSGGSERRQANLGTGVMNFGESGVPAGIITPGWVFCPLLSFYVPPANSAVLTEVAVSDPSIGSGCTLEGTSNLGLEELTGQKLSLKGRLVRKDGVVLSFATSSVLDSSGWPSSGSGSVEGGGLTVGFTVKRVVAAG